MLLGSVVGLMMSLKYCSVPPAGTLRERHPSGGDTVDVAISYSPMTLYRYDDTLGGFCYDLLRELERLSDLTFKFHPVTSASASLEGVQSGLYDLLVSDMARTSELDADYAFTNDVYLDKQVLVQLKDSAGGIAVDSQLDLAGKHVWVEASTPAYWRLKHLSAEIGDTIYVETDRQYTSEQLLIKVAVGDVPFAVINDRVARRLSADYPDIDVSTGISFTQFQTWLARSGDSLLVKRINQAIDSAKAVGIYDRLARRYGVE